MKNRLLFCILLFISSIFISCSLDTKQHVDFRISGMVLDAATQKGIDNLQVDLRSKNLGVFAHLLTENGGIFSIEGADGGYDLGDSLWVISRDIIDSTQNGWYITDSLQVLLLKEVDEEYEKLTTSKAENIRLYLKKRIE